MQQSSGYKTKQRELILNFLKNNQNKHICVDDIIDNLKSQGDPVGKSTAYRYMDKLVEQGIVKKYVLEGQSSAYYEYLNSVDCVNHYHMKCLKCAKLYHVECSHLSEMSIHIKSHHNFNLDISKITLYGHCVECQ